MHVTSETCRAKKRFKKKEYCTSSWIWIKHMLPICTEPQTLKICEMWALSVSESCGWVGAEGSGGLNREVWLGWGWRIGWPEQI
jgi:hypothetical protein